MLCSVVHAFITSRLDYCNSLFAQCNVSTRQRLQRVQNRADHLVLNAPSRTPSLPLLQQLHWLPVEAIKDHLKLCLLMYCVVVHRTAPVYLAELCQPCTDPRRRSTARGDFEIPRTDRHFTNSSFSIAAPTAWNKLPTHIRTSTTPSSFLSRLKTHLYNYTHVRIHLWAPGLLQLAALRNDRQSVPASTVGAERAGQADHKDRSTSAHHTRSKGTTLAARSTPRRLQAGNVHVQDAARPDTTVLVGRLSAHLRRKSPTTVVRHVYISHATDQNSSG